MKNINEKKIIEILNKGKMILKKIVVPITLSGAIMLSGCSLEKKDIIKKMQDKGISTELINSGDHELYKVNAYDIDELYKFETNETIYSEYKELDYDYFCTPSEFSDYTGEYNLTWNDIKNTINNNKNIDDEIRGIILSGVSNLEKNNFNMNLATLNYNLKKLKIEYDIHNNLDENNINVLAEFIPREQKVVIYYKNSNNFNRVICHEIFGHGMTLAYIPEQKVLCRNTLHSIVIDDDKYLGSKELGNSFEEAEAELITYYSYGKKINHDDSCYTMFEYILLLLCNTNDVSIQEYADKGIEYLIEKMNNCNNIRNSVDYIEKIDYIFNGILNDEYYGEFCSEDIITEYLYQIVEVNSNKFLDYKNLREFMKKNIYCSNKFLIPYHDEETGLNGFVVQNGDIYDSIVLENLVDNVNEYIDLYETISREDLYYDDSEQYILVK